MEKSVSTCGKTWHTWHADQDIELSCGNPALMLVFTKDGQLNADLLAHRGKQFGISTAKKRKNRADILDTPVRPGADSWQMSETVQLPNLTNHKHDPVNQHSFQGEYQKRLGKF